MCGEPSTRAAEAIFGGPSHLCAIAAGKVYCAGRTNFAADGPRAGGASSAPYGGGTTSRFTALTEVTGLPYVVEVADGNDHTCVRARDGAVWCWGAGRFGQVGPGSRGGTTPVAVPLEGRALELSVGHRTTCAVVEGGRLYCWGELRLGQCVEEQRDTLGQSVCFVREPSAVPLDGVTDVGVGARQACALAAGSVYCFRTSTDAPAQITRVATIANALAIEVGWAHACVRTTAGAVWCWREDDASPTRVTDGVAALHLGAAAGLDLLLGTDGAVRRLDPSWRVGPPVAALDGARALAAGWYPTMGGGTAVCGLFEGGVVRCVEYHSNDVTFRAPFAPRWHP